MQAHLLSLNNFNMPLVYSGDVADYAHIVYLLLLEKGKFQSHPDMGVGIRSRYRFTSEENMLNNLQEDIKDQISKYLPSLENVTNVTVNLFDEDKFIGILIEANDGVYAISYNKEDDEIKTGDKLVIEALV